MAEIQFNQAYENLTDAQKRQFDGVMGMGGFNERYQKNPESPLVTSDPDYAAFAPISKAYQESKTIPKGNFLSNMFNFSSADASMPDQTYGLPTNTMGGMTLNPDGTISYNTEPPQNLGYTPIMDAVRANEDFMGQFNTNNAIDEANQVGGTTQQLIDRAIAQNNMQKMMNAPRTQDIDIDSLRDPFAPIENQFNVHGVHPAAFDPYGNKQMALEKEDFYEPSKFQNFKSKAKTGWEGLKGGLQSLFDKTMVGRVLGGIGNMFEDRQLTGDVMDEYGNMYSAADLNKMNAKGGYYTEAARSARRRTSRIANMRQRLEDDKKISHKNLHKLVAQEKAQQLRDAKNAADRANIQNIQNYTGKELSGYRMSRPPSERGFTGHGKSGMGRDPKDKMARGGRVRFANGGLASLFTRRG